MIHGLYAAASGMIAIEDRQAVIANNIANSATAGFKRQNSVNEGFKQIFLGAMGSPERLNMERGPGGGLKTSNVYTDYAGGSIGVTGNPLHIALQGPGFLSVDTPAGERFTRDGALTIDANGQLTTANGYPVLSEGGALVVQGGNVEFGPDGSVLVDNVPVGRLRVVEFDDPHLMERYGESLFAPAEKSGGPRPAELTSVVPGALENSNVQLPYEMAQMMLGLRMYNANQKVISSVDETVGRLINEVGMPT
ncbi:MAG TPA: flagellar hook-basal body protein [Candidatus Hydrogenedentes bacterium]|mgnify:CR=1 FL=1|nr:flagellar hook-basal body protein [Candidatus Hydrogenedentota bacterium]